MFSRVLRIGTLAKAFAIRNSSTILTVGSSAGVAVTAYLAFKAGAKANEEIAVKEDYGEEVTKKDKAKVIAKKSIAPAIAGGLTIGMIIASGIINIKRQKALSAALALSTEAMATYKDKVVETLGEKKEADIRSKIVEDEIRKNPPNETTVYNTGTGDQLFRDGNAYFRASAEWVRKKQNEANQWYTTGEDFISVNEWYGLIGLEPDDKMEGLGWNIDERINFDFVAAMTPGGEACLAIVYDIYPRNDYGSLH